MPLTDEFIPFHLRLVPGQDRTNRDTLLETNKVEAAENARFNEEVGSVVKRPKRAYYNATSVGANPFHALYRFYTTTSKFLLGAYLGTMKVGTDVGGTFASIATGLTSGEAFTFATYKNLCIFSNGSDNIMQTDGVVAWELGACKAVTLAGGTNLDASAAYYYAVTMDTDAYTCGAVSNTVTTGAAGGNRQVTLSNIPLGPAGTVNRRIYRTVGGGASLLLLATISDNTTTTYVDNIADGTLGAAMPAVTDDMPKGKYIKIYRERLFVASGANEPNRIYFSDAFLPHYIQGTTATSYKDVSPDDGDEITGIPIQLGTMCIFKRNNIRKMHIDSSDPDGWFIDDPISYQGSPAPQSIQQTPYGVYYQGWDHLYNFNGAASTPIIDEFKVDEQIKSNSKQYSVGFWNDNDYYLSYISADGGVDYQDRTMIFNQLRSALSIDSYGAASFAAFKGGDETGELYIGDSQNGYVYLARNFPQTISLRTTTQLNGNLSYPTNIYSGLDDISFEGTEEEPTIRIGWATTINNAVGTLNAGYSGTATIDQPDASGTYTSEVFFVSASAFGTIKWHEILPTGCDVVFSTRSGSTEAACLAAAWDGGLTNPNGSTIASAAAEYIQFKAVLTSPDAYSTPRIVSQDGYAIQFTYTPGGTEETTNIPFVYGTGFRNFGRHNDDKIYKKIIVSHSGVGTYTLTWTTDSGETGSFTVDMSLYPYRWESFFPSNAFGRTVKFTVAKTDTSDLTLKEILGVWSPRPMLI